MELKKVCVDGYRNVTNTVVDLYDITSILSTNNYGKSNLLFSIVFGLSFLQQHPKIKFNMMNDSKCMPILKNSYGHPFSFQIEGVVTHDNRPYFVKYSYKFAWGNPVTKTQGEIFSELLQISENNRDFTTFIKRSGADCFYKSSPKGRCVTKVEIDGHTLAVNKLSSFDGLFYLEIIKQLLNVNVYIDRHFDTASGYGITFMSEQELTDLTLKPEMHIPKTLYRFKQDYPDKFALLVNVYKSLFPDVEDLIVEEVTSRIPRIKIKQGDEIPSFSDKVYLLFVKDKNLKYAISFDAMSDGAKRILLLLTFVVLAQLNDYSLICIEEPENSINPGLLRSFLFSIKELSEDTKILYSSHSPYLINYMEPSNVFLGIPSKTGEAMFRKIKANTNNIKKLMRTLQDNNLALGDYLFDLMSGTEADCEELLSYVE